MQHTVTHGRRCFPDHGGVCDAVRVFATCDEPDDPGDELDEPHPAVLHRGCRSSDRCRCAWSNWPGRSGIYIAVEGPTGVGKTTLTTRLAAKLTAVAVYDPFDANPFLAELLADDRRDPALALRVELTFVALRIAQLRDIGQLLAAGHSVVADWALLKQPIFATTSLDAPDVARVAATVDLWERSVPRPDVLIGLSAATAVLRQRVRQRGRGMEAGLTGAHLQALSAGFDAAYAGWDRPLIRIDAGTFDTFHDAHIHRLAAQVGQLPIPVEAR